MERNLQNSLTKTGKLPVCRLADGVQWPVQAIRPLWCCPTDGKLGCGTTSCLGRPLGGWAETEPSLVVVV